MTKDLVVASTQERRPQPSFHRPANTSTDRLVNAWREYDLARFGGASEEAVLSALQAVIAIERDEMDPKTRVAELTIAASDRMESVRKLAEMYVEHARKARARFKRGDVELGHSQAIQATASMKAARRAKAEAAAYLAEAAAVARRQDFADGVVRHLLAAE